MRLILAVIATTLTLAWIAPDTADAQSTNRGARAKSTKSQPGKVVARRSASTGQNGLCQRDTGTPMDKLDFRNRCDVEEYWARMNERTSSGNL